MDIYNVCRYFMDMYTMYPYSVYILLCTTVVDYLCILGMNSMYAYYTGFFLTGRILPHLKKFSPVDFPLPSFYPPSPHQKPIPPIK